MCRPVLHSIGIAVSGVDCSFAPYKSPLAKRVPISGVEGRAFIMAALKTMLGPSHSGNP